MTTAEERKVNRDGNVSQRLWCESGISSIKSVFSFVFIKLSACTAPVRTSYNAELDVYASLTVNARRCAAHTRDSCVKSKFRLLRFVRMQTSPRHLKLSQHWLSRSSDPAIQLLSQTAQTSDDQFGQPLHPRPTISC